MAIPTTTPATSWDNGATGFDQELERWNGNADETFTVIDPAAPCAWCDTTDRPRIQRGPSFMGWQCADADACNATWQELHRVR